MACVYFTIPVVGGVGLFYLFERLRGPPQFTHEQRMRENMTKRRAMEMLGEGKQAQPSLPQQQTQK
jgi:hypothetical protein